MEKTPPRHEPTWDECTELLTELPTLPLADRGSVIERLVRCQRPGIRERALRMGAAVISDEALVDFLHNDSDAVLRNAALEILKLRGGSSLALAIELLADEEPDVVLQAVLLLDDMKDPRAVEPLRSVLHHRDPNIAQAAIVAMGHLGDARAIPELLPFLESDTWLQVAAIQALGDLRSGRGIGPLHGLLDDAIVGPMAAEAMAKIGGLDALSRLTEHWIEHEDVVDPETSLGLLAHVLEGLDEDPAPSERLRRSLAERLRDPYRKVRESAARCLLALGRGPEDAEALSLLAGTSRNAEVLPSCLARRSDLIGTLLEKTGIPQSWGFILTARHPTSAVAEQLARALGSVDPDVALKPILEALEKLPAEELAAPVLELYLSLPDERRPEMLPVLALHRKGLGAALARKTDISPVERIILQAALGDDEAAVARRIAQLDEEQRLAAVIQLSDQPSLVRALPWDAWLAESPAAYVAVASQAAAAAQLLELMPMLRAHFATEPCAELVRTAGELEDRESVPSLLELLGRRDLRHLRPLVFEALGRIGGARARQALREQAVSDDEKDSRLGFKALAMCADDTDLELFHRAAGHADWLIRLAAVEVLARSARPRDLEVLSGLAADPAKVVAQRALEALRRAT